MKLCCSLFALALCGSGCHHPHQVITPPDGGPPPELTILDPPGSQIGLHYGKSVILRVSYHAADSAMTPERGAQVLFSIFGDPAGSTLSADEVTTDATGVAQVKLTAGAAEASFRVTASAPNASDVDFQVAVSKLDFVELKVQLDWDASAPTTLSALLYANQPCSALPPAPALPSAPPMRQAQSAGPSASVDFINLLSMSYSVVGRAADADGNLLADGCVDVPSALAPAGSMANLPLPLVAVTPSAVGSYTLTSSFTIATDASQPATQPWHALTGCPLGMAQALLDNTSDQLSSPSLVNAISALRGAPSGSSNCRPSTVASKSSLDADLQALLDTSGAPDTSLGSMVSDLDALVSAAQLTSTLTLTPTGASALSGEHALGTLTLGGPSGASEAIDLVASGLPVIDVKDIAVAYDQGNLSISTHGFSLGLPSLWLGAFESVAVGKRFPALMPPSTRGFLGLAVSAVSHGGMSGCSGIEDLVCTRTAAPSCTGNIAPACLSALDRLTTQLEAGFGSAPGIDFILTGQCQALDENGDLTLDTLSDGTWTTAVASDAGFSGTRQ